MAIVTATIAAIAATTAAISTIGAAAAGAATIGAAVAATASAVVAVSTVVGMAGLVVTGVGMITGNEDLLQAGEIMGYVGLGGSVLGFGVGAAAEGFSAFSSRMGDLYSKSWDKGMGKMFSSSADDATGAAAKGVTTGKGDFATGPGTGKVSPDVPTIGGPKPTDLTGLDPAVKPGAPGFLSNSPPPAGTNAPGVATPSTIDPTAHLSRSVSSATQAPTVGAPSAAASSAPTVGAAATQTAAKAAEPGMMSGFLNNPMMPLAAGQIISGGAGGLFEASATEEQTEMLRQKNAQDEAQRQYLNRNNSFAPGTV